MKISIPLDDARLFLAVADSGSLSGAAQLTATSLPTLSRRMARLEQTIGQRLFERGRKGYALTSAGRALLGVAEPLRAVSARLETLCGTPATHPVRITAGHWTARFLARNFANLASGAAWRPEFLAATALVDIARREADIGIRNRRPDQPWLAARKTRRVDYAVYATRADVTGFIGLPETHEGPASQTWLRRNHGTEITLTISDTRLALDFALQGAGRIVLPVFEGAANPGLQRISANIEALAHDEWLVSHHEGRHDPPVRAALDAIWRVLSDPYLRPPG